MVSRDAMILSIGLNRFEVFSGPDILFLSWMFKS